MEFTAIPLLISFALLFWWRSVVLFKRTVEDVPTSKVKGVFYGLNEVKGAVKSGAPLQTYLTERPSVWHEWSFPSIGRKPKAIVTRMGTGRPVRRAVGGKSIREGESKLFFFWMIRGNCSSNRRELKLTLLPRCRVFAVHPIHCTTGRDQVERLRIQPTAEGFPRVRSLLATTSTFLVRPN